jgi:acyl-CoA thioester hydrolase
MSDNVPASEWHPYIYTFRVGYADTDKMGFLHHSRYAVYAEWARTEYLRFTGESYKQWEDEGFLLPVVGIEFEFGAPARYDDIVEVHTEIVSVTRLRLNFDYEFRSAASGAVLSKAKSRHVFMDASGRPRRIEARRESLLRACMRPTP